MIATVDRCLRDSVSRRPLARLGTLLGWCIFFSHSSKLYSSFWTSAVIYVYYRNAESSFLCVSLSYKTINLTSLFIVEHVTFDIT